MRSLTPGPFIGAEHYINALTDDPDFANALRPTAMFVIIDVAITMVSALGLVVLVLPFAVSPALVGISARFMFNAEMAVFTWFAGVIALFQPSDIHADIDAYMDDLAEGMRHEYEGIAAAGLTLQIDAPDLALRRHMLYPDATKEAFLHRAARHVEVIYHALRNIAPDRVRLHVC